MFNKNFYPTPRDIVAKMYNTLDHSLMRNILEPSAGKGNIADYVLQASNTYRPYTVKVIEIEPELRSILSGKGYSVIAHDFLNFNGHYFFDTIIMNPPFSDGDKHLLKAIELMKEGGQITCLLNAETIRNPYTNDRKRLVELLEKYNAEIRYIEKAFADAERKTDVECAIVTIKIKCKPLSDSDIFKNCRLEAVEEASKEFGAIADNENLPAVYDEIKTLIEDYKTEVELYLASVESIRAYNNFSAPRHKQNFSEMSVKITYDYHNNSLPADIIKDIRLRYWNKVLESSVFEKYTTRKKMSEITKKIEQQGDIEFSLHNILEIKSVLIQFFVTSLEESAISLFEEITQYHQNEYSKNVHYYSGWKTNKSSRINKKIILPSYINRNLMANEIIKVLNYFDAFKEYADLYVKKSYFSDDSGVYEHEYLTIQVYKKGTMHITFKRIDLLDKFNIFVGRHYNWLPDATESNEVRTKIYSEVVQHYSPDSDIDSSINTSSLLLLN